MRISIFMHGEFKITVKCFIAGDAGDKGDKGDRGFTTTINSDGQFPTGIIEGPPGKNLSH